MAGWGGGEALGGQASGGKRCREALGSAGRQARLHTCMRVQRSHSALKWGWSNRTAPRHGPCSSQRYRTSTCNAFQPAAGAAAAAATQAAAGPRPAATQTAGRHPPPAASRAPRQGCQLSTGQGGVLVVQRRRTMPRARVPRTLFVVLCPAAVAQMKPAAPVRPATACKPLSPCFKPLPLSLLLQAGSSLARTASLGPTSPSGPSRPTFTVTLKRSSSLPQQAPQRAASGSVSATSSTGTGGSPGSSASTSTSRLLNPSAAGYEPCCCGSHRGAGGSSGRSSVGEEEARRAACDSPTITSACPSGGGGGGPCEACGEQQGRRVAPPPAGCEGLQQQHPQPAEKLAKDDVMQ